MSQVLQDVTDMAVDFERSHGYSLPTFEVQYVSYTNSSSSQQADYKKHTTNVDSTGKIQMLALPGRTLQKGLSNSPQAKFP